MTKILATLTICLFIVSCTKTTDETYSYTFEENAELILESNEGIYMKYTRVVEGTDLVFTYEYKAEDDINTVDDEYSEYIQFQIEPSMKEFSFSNNELENIKAVYSERCFCGYSNEEEKNVAPKGTISGKKVSETEWEIMIDAAFYGDVQKSITNIFRLEK